MSGDPLEDERRRIRAVYRRYAADPHKRRDWSATNPGNAAIREELVAAAFELAGSDLVAGKATLDIGCGTGWWLERLAAKEASRLHGLELLSERAAAASQRVPSARIEIGDARALPYEDGRFDAVTLFTVLSSLATALDLESALAEARRVLAPGGALLIWEPRVRNPGNRATLLVTPALLDGVLGQDLVVSRLTTVVPVVARRLGRHTERLYPALASIRPLLTHRLVCAHKVM